MNSQHAFATILLCLNLTAQSADNSYFSSLFSRAAEYIKGQHKLYTALTAAATIGSLIYIKNHFINKPQNNQPAICDSPDNQLISSQKPTPIARLNHVPHSVSTITIVDAENDVIATAIQTCICIWHKQPNGQWKLQQIAGNNVKKNALSHIAAIKTLASLEKHTIISGSADGTALIWKQNLFGAWYAYQQLGLPENKDNNLGHTCGITSIEVVSPEKIITTSLDRCALVWQCNDSSDWHITNRIGAHRNTHEPHGHIAALMTAAAVDQSTIATGGADHSVIIWKTDDLGNWYIHQRLGQAYNDNQNNGHIKEVRAIVPITEGLIASGSLDRTVILWQKNNDDNNWSIMQRLGELYNLKNSMLGHTNGITALVCPDEETLISGSLDKTGIIWKKNLDGNWKLSKRLGRTNNNDAQVGHTNGITGLALTHDKKAISSSLDQSALCWKLS
jgi:WD40 repeat protein